MKKISIFFAALVAVLFSVAETNAQITPPYYNPANVRITGGTINGATIGQTTPTAGTFTNLAANTLFTVGSGSTTNAGFIIGYSSVSGSGNIWSTSVTPSTINYALTTSGAGTAINGTSASYMAAANSIKFTAGTVLNTSANPLSVTDATDSSSITTGSLKTAGGLGVAKKAYFGDRVQIGDGATTNTGVLAGYLGASGYGALWPTSVTPSTTNYAVRLNSVETVLNSTNIARLSISSSPVLSVSSTAITHVGDMVYDKTITAAGTTGAQTINKTTGRVNFAAAATSLVVTNSLATANSICHVTKATNDATMRLGACVAAAGSITIYADVAPAAETAVNFTVTN